MAAEIATDSFLDLLQQSGLVSEDQVLALREEFGVGRAGALDSRKLAEELVSRGILTEWQAQMLLQGKHRGFRLGPHRILRPLGQGGMSKVFLAEHEMMHRRCAIKVLPSKYQEDPDLLNRFYLEARAIAALDHPNIVRAYDFNKDVRYGKEIHYLVMEYVDGQDLRRMVEEQGPLDCRKAADFIAQAAEGLAHAHQAGFVHRDIKPANLLVDRNGVLKILDLGLARFTFEGNQPWQNAESEQSAVGTADYVAPEQIADSRNVDGRADIYSLGHTFYFLLTGRRPFPKATLVELLMAHRSEQPEPIDHFRPDVPLELTDIIAKMTVKKPVQRFSTAKEVAERLRAWLRDSESGGYSRISALMAAAKRAKQLAAAQEAAAQKAAQKETELELAEIEDAPPTPVESPAARSTPKAGLEKPVVAERSSSPVVAERSSSNVLADILADLPPAPAKSDPLLVLPSQDGPTAFLSSTRLRAGKKPPTIFRSPWLWAGMVWVVVLLLLVLILIRLPFRGEPDADKRLPETAMEPPAPQQSVVPSQGEYASKPQPPEETRPPVPPVIEQPAPEQSESPAPPKAVEPLPSDPPVRETPPESKPSPPEAAPSTPHEPPAAEPESKPPPEEKPSAEPPDPIKLLAGMKTLGLHIRSTDPDKNSYLNQTVVREAVGAARQLGLSPPGVSGSPVMEITISATESGDVLTVVLAAEVKYSPARETVVSLWKEEKRVASIALQRVRPEQVQKVLKAGISKFFDQFVADVRRARQKTGV